MGKIMKKLKARKKTVIIIVCLVIIGVIGARNMFGNDVKSDEESPDYLNATVVRGDIESIVSGDGSVTPRKRSELRVELDGTIDQVFVVEGQKIAKGDPILTLESNSYDANIKLARLNLQSTQNDLADLKEDLDSLNIYAPESGLIDVLFEDEGYNLNKGSVFASISEGNSMEIVAPFNTGSANGITVGDTAKVLVSGFYQNVDGVVTKVNKTTKASEDGGVYNEITVEIENPGGIVDQTLGFATIDNDQGSFQAIEQGMLSSKLGDNIQMDVSATLEELYVVDGDYVNKGDLIAAFKSDELITQIENQNIQIKQRQIQLQESLENLGDSVLTASIDGTIIRLDVTGGDNVERNEAVAAIADIENLEVVIPVDELDIKNIGVNQQASVTTDVFPEKMFDAEVVKIAMEGDESSGVTTYDVTLELKESEGLMLSMNINAEVVIESKKDVLILPLEAVQKNGNLYGVLQNGEKLGEDETPAFKKIEIGLISDYFVEIVGGLEEGDIVKYTAALGSSEALTDKPVMRVPGMGGGNGGGGLK